MGSILPRFTDGPRTYEAVEGIVGGTLVEARAGGVELPAVGIAAAGSVKVLGVAQKDASVHPGTAAPRSPVAGVLDTTMAPFEVAVINDGFVPCKYAAAAAYGDRLIAAANGTVTPAGATPDARTVVGWCAEKGGVLLGGTGLTRINL
jgi:hypothetical protein